MELKLVLPDIDKTFTSKIPFKSAVPNRKILRSYSDVEYIVGFMPGGIATHAGNGKLFEWKERAGPFSIGGLIVPIEDGLEMKNFHFCFPNVEKGTDCITVNPKVTRLNLVQWFGSEIVRMNYRRSNGQLEIISISRETLIKRLANILDGSHTSLGKNSDFSNKFDEPIKFLMDFKCGGCPIPYYLLLKVAQDIVEFAPRLIEGLGETCNDKL